MLQCFSQVLIIIPNIWRTLFPEVESLSALEQEETEFLTWEEMCIGTIEILLGVILISVSLHSTPWGFVSLSGMGLVSPCMAAFYIKCDQQYTTCGPNGETWHRLNWHNCGTQSLCASVGPHQACIAYIYTFHSHFFPGLFPFISLFWLSFHSSLLSSQWCLSIVSEWVYSLGPCLVQWCSESPWPISPCCKQALGMF